MRTFMVILVLGAILGTVAPKQDKKKPKHDNGKNKPPLDDGWSFDKYKLILDELPPQTCIGKMVRPLEPEGTTDQEQYSVWVQDPPTKRLRFDMGHPGEKEFTQLYLTANSSYAVVTPGEDANNLICVSAGTNFDEVYGAYVYPYVRYMSNGVWNNKPVRFFAGSSPDPFTHTSINNVAFVGLNSEYYGMAILSTTGYIFYDYNVTLGVPEDQWFEPPAICNA